MRYLKTGLIEYNPIKAYSGATLFSPLFHKVTYLIDLKGNIGIILGSEGRGIRRLTLEDSDFKATIPMQGEVNSLNVSASCAVILSERLRQISN